MLVNSKHSLYNHSKICTCIPAGRFQDHTAVARSKLLDIPLMPFMAGKHCCSVLAALQQKRYVSWGEVGGGSRDIAPASLQLTDT